MPDYTHRSTSSIFGTDFRRSTSPCLTKRVLCTLSSTPVNSLRRRMTCRWSNRHRTAQHSTTPGHASERERCGRRICFILRIKSLFVFDCVYVCGCMYVCVCVYVCVCDVSICVRCLFVCMTCLPVSVYLCDICATYVTV